MRSIKVKASKEYEVIIGRDLLKEAGEMILPCFGGRRIALVTDSNVDVLYADEVEHSLSDVGFQTVRFTFPAGEESKSMSTYAALQEFLAEKGLSRKDGIVALGGGVVGDMAGFAAATYLRGIDFVQIPTTLLAAVDSSVGGKTGIDLAAGKNLCGAFHQPRLVICDVNTLDTLKDSDFIGGMAEVIKYGVIRDRKLFDLLESSICEIMEKGAVLEEIIAECVGIKRDVVEADEFEGGLRAILNFGHTAAHAIESISSYRIPHGIAVGAGMAIAAEYAASEGAMPEDDADRLCRLIKSYGLPTNARDAAEMCGVCPAFNAETMAKAAQSDKKAGGGWINLVIPAGIGDCRIEKTETDKLPLFFGGLSDLNI